MIKFTGCMEIYALQKIDRIDTYKWTEINFVRDKGDINIVDNLKF